MTNIITARKSGFIVRGGKSVRQMTWVAGAWTDSTIAANTKLVLTTFNASALARRPFTIVRTRGVLFIDTDQVAADEQQAAIYGKIVVNEKASDLGATAIPFPETVGTADFFVYEPILAAMHRSATGIYQSGLRVTIDSKAMRRVDQQDQVVEVVETPASPISEGIQFRSFTRTLIKLH